MDLENVYTTLLLGNDFDYTLFKTAIFYAELGLTVWFISPETFEKIPENIAPPEKEVSQLITFFYLKDYKDLLSHLNGIHLWHKMPNIIILSDLEKFCNLYCENYNSLLTALVSTTLLDSASVCARKKQNSYLILSCKFCEDHKERLQVLQDMYFPNVINKVDDSKLYFNEIIDKFKLIKS